MPANRAVPRGGPASKRFEDAGEASPSTDYLSPPMKLASRRDILTPELFPGVLAAGPTPGAAAPTLTGPLYSGTRIGSSIATISARFSSNHGGSNSEVPSLSAGSSR